MRWDAFYIIGCQSIEVTLWRERKETNISFSFVGIETLFFSVKPVKAKGIALPAPTNQLTFISPNVHLFCLHDCSIQSLTSGKYELKSRSWDDRGCDFPTWSHLSKNICFVGWIILSLIVIWNKPYIKSVTNGRLRCMYYRLGKHKDRFPLSHLPIQHWLCPHCFNPV